LQKFAEKALRLAFHLPWHYALIRRILARRGEVSLEEARFLGALVQRANPARPIVEIGTLFGGSTRVLAILKAPETRLITVDCFRWNPFGLSRKQHAEVTRTILSDAGSSSNIELLQMDKADFYSSYSDDPPGLVFLDANHSYESTLEDIDWARSVGAEIIAGHDYSPRFPGVIRAVDDSGGASRIVGTLFELAHSGSHSRTARS